VQSSKAAATTTTATPRLGQWQNPNQLVLHQPSENNKGKGGGNSDDKLVLAFQNRGDYQWLATLKLFRAAFPDKRLVLANPMHAAHAVNVSYYRDFVFTWKAGGAPVQVVNAVVTHSL
jgi:hypothetical protein